MTTKLKALSPVARVRLWAMKACETGFKICGKTLKKYFDTAKALNFDEKAVSAALPDGPGRPEKLSLPEVQALGDDLVAREVDKELAAAMRKQHAAKKRKGAFKVCDRYVARRERALLRFESAGLLTDGFILVENRFHDDECVCNECQTRATGAVQAEIYCISQGKEDDDDDTDYMYF